MSTRFKLGTSRDNPNCHVLPLSKVCERKEEPRGNSTRHVGTRNLGPRMIVSEKNWDAINSMTTI